MSLNYQTDDDDLPGEDLISEDLTAVSSSFPLYTVILLGAFAVVAAVQFGTGLESSILAAGFDKPAFIGSREYWRILTGGTTHGSIPHVVMNGYALYSFGRIFEMLSNRAHLAVVYLLSVIGGGVLSLIFAPDGLSVGASGGILGLVSYLAIYAFRRRQFISREFRKSLLINIAFILVFGLVLYQVIDNSGHIGGLVAGAVYGVVQIPSDEYTDPRLAGSITESLGLTSLGIYLAACAFSVLLILRLV